MKGPAASKAARITALVIIIASITTHPSKPRLHRGGSQLSSPSLAVGVQAIVKLPFILIRPILRNVMRTVDCAAGPVHEEWLIRLEGSVLVQPTDRIVREVFA